MGTSRVNGLSTITLGNQQLDDDEGVSARDSQQSDRKNSQLCMFQL
jgi:hypothetical protein